MYCLHPFFTRSPVLSFSENLPIGEPGLVIHSFPSLYCIDCRLMAQFSMFLCPLDIDTWVKRFEQTFGKTVRFSLFCDVG